MWPSTTFLALLASAALPVSVLAEHGLQARGHHAAIAKRAENSTIEKRFSNTRFTYFAVGLGACGKVSKPSDFMVALNDKQFGGGYPGPNCFKQITISYGGKTTSATILDECPGCPYGGLDLSQGLFEFFAPTSAGVIYGEWSFGGGGGGNDSPPPKKPDPPKAAPKPEAPKPDPPKSEAARVQVKSKTSTKASSTSKSKSKTSTKASSTKISTSKVASSTSASAVNYHKGNAGNLAVPTGTPSDDAPYVAGGLNSLDEVIIQFGGLIVAGGKQA